MDVQERRLDLLVDEAELERRRADWKAPEQRYQRGYNTLFLQHVLQADQGCDFDFLRGKPGVIPEPDIF